MKTLHNKLIIYDSNCKVCSSLRDIVLKFTNIPSSKIAAYKDLNEEESKSVDPDRFRNGMALVDTAGGPTIYGAPGVAYIFSTEYKIAAFLLQFRAFFILFDFLYKILAYNRYIIATPKSRFKCDCFPDKIIKYRAQYIAITVLISTLLTALFGVSLHDFVPGISTSQAAIQILLMAGTGWILQMIVAAIAMKENALDYIGHLGSIMVAGLLVLLPWIFLHAITGTTNFYLPIVSVGFSSALMLYMHIKRVKSLGLSQWYTFSWFVLLQSGALVWIYIFHLK